MSSPVREKKKLALGTRVIIGLLTGSVAFAAIMQARIRDTDALSSLRQPELVRLLDELTVRTEALTTERDELRAELADLESGVISQTEAAAAAAARIQTLSIQAGVAPVHGPGVEIVVEDEDGGLSAQSLVSLVEELRNAGAEAIEVNGVRIGASSWFADETDGLVLEGEPIESPYIVRAIGDPGAMSVALEMPGGIVSSYRQKGASTEIAELDDVEIMSVRSIAALEQAEVVE